MVYSQRAWFWQGQDPRMDPPNSAHLGLLPFAARSKLGHKPKLPSRRPASPCQPCKPFETAEPAQHLAPGATICPGCQVVNGPPRSKLGLSAFRYYTCSFEVIPRHQTQTIYLNGARSCLILNISISSTFSNPLNTLQHQEQVPWCCPPGNYTYILHIRPMFLRPMFQSSLCDS